MTKLTDTQLVVLSAAANREDGSILPLPSNLKGGAAAKVVDGLVRRGLAERVESDGPAVPDLVRITRTGLKAIGVEPDDRTRAQQRPAKTKRKASKPRKAGGDEKPRRTRADSKQARALDMLRRPKGASNKELQTALGWQPHTVRGFIAGAVKKKLGLTVESEKVEDRGRIYRIVKPA